MANYHTIDFHLKQNNAPVAINFLPYGTRTLKVRMIKSGDDPNVYILRSSHPAEGFGKKRYYTHEEGGSNFRLSWGGGQKTGACVEAKDVVKIGGQGILQGCVPMSGPMSYTYLNLTHLSGDVDKTYVLKLGAYLEDGKIGDPPVYSLQINLTPPEQVANGEVIDPVRPGQDPRNFTFKGSHAPVYLARWWSPAKVIYEPVPDLPELHITAEDQTLNIHIEGRRKPLATIEDYVGAQDILESRFFNAELYRWNEYYVVRLWFSWLESDGWKTLLDEKPDAERFDFVIDADERYVKYAGTDLHWREVWVNFTKNQRRSLRARLGLFSPSAKEELKPVITFIDEAKEFEKEEDVKLPRIPTDTVVPEGRVAPDQAIWDVKAHVPFFRNAEPENIHFVSSDPRVG